ncbi:MAG: phosphatidylglycerol lysyltransferase domain-containing protein [Candidatus Omnitrophota bacterium]
MARKELTLKDKNLLHNYLTLKEHELSVYAFENIYIWKALFKVTWDIIEDNLCIFFQDKIGMFLYLPPLGKSLSRRAVDEAFRLMDKENKNKEVSRIENIEDADLRFFKDLGFICKDKFPEYLCRRVDLAGLKGNRFKPKRASFNYFIKNYSGKYLPFGIQDARTCLGLYQSWMQERNSAYQDPVYQGMLADNLGCLKLLLRDYRKLNFIGRVVKISGVVKGFTFGFRLDKDTLCIIYEVTDLSIKGLAQFIFREFCRELKEYSYINIMDDSGLENLRRVKKSFRPQRLIPSFIASRDNR